MSRTEVLTTVTGTNLGESPKAIRFRVDMVGTEPIDPPKYEWFPFSQIRKIETNKNLEGADTLVVTEWILKAKELI